MSSVTLVTAYLTLESRRNQTTNAAHYLKVGAPLLQVDCPVIIFVDKESYMSVWKLRAGFHDKTRFVMRELKETKLYRYKELIDAVRNVYWPTRDARAGSDVHIMGGSKYEFMLESIDWNPFGTTHFAWIDFGFAQTGCSTFDPTALLSVLKQVPDKCSVQMMNDVSDALLADLSEYFKSYRFSLAGNFWTCNAKYGSLVCEAAQSKWIEHMKKGYGHGDETPLRYVLHEHPEWFSLRFGDYKQHLENFVSVTENADFLVDLLWRVLLSESNRAEWTQQLATQLFQCEKLNVKKKGAFVPYLSPIKKKLDSDGSKKDDSKKDDSKKDDSKKDDVVTQCTDLIVVANDGSKSLEQLKNSKTKIVIYHKDLSKLRREDNDLGTHETIEDVGLESHVFLSHIIQNWDRLSDVQFVSTYPQDTTPNAGDLDDAFGDFETPSDFKTMRAWWSEMFSSPFPSTLSFAPISTVSATQIKRIPQWFYDRLAVGIRQDRNPQESLFLRRIWPCLFSSDLATLFSSPGEVSCFPRRKVLVVSCPSVVLESSLSSSSSSSSCAITMTTDQKVNDDNDADDDGYEDLAPTGNTNKKNSFRWAVVNKDDDDSQETIKTTTIETKEHDDIEERIHCMEKEIIWDKTPRRFRLVSDKILQQFDQLVTTCPLSLPKSWSRDSVCIISLS